MLGSTDWRLKLRRRVVLARLAGRNPDTGTAAAQIAETMRDPEEPSVLLDLLEDAWGLPIAVSALLAARRLSPFQMIGLLRNHCGMPSSQIDSILIDAGLSPTDRRSALRLGR